MRGIGRNDGVGAGVGYFLKWLPWRRSSAPKTTPRQRADQRSRWLRYWRLLWRMVGLLTIISVLLVAGLRSVPLPTSSVITQYGIRSWWNSKAPAVRYVWTPYSEIAPEAALAVLAAEDQRFPEHRGFDFVEIQNVLHDQQDGKRPRGASTISQQVAKNLFLWSGRSLIRKGLEVWFTLLLELLWSKQRILEVYLNIAEFGEGTFGVEAASRRFFNKPAARLTDDQAARLAAILPNPVRYRADKPSAYVLKRQQWIERQMVQLGGIAYLDKL